MLSEDEVELYLQEQAVNLPVQLAGESVRLDVSVHGAQLSATLLSGYQSEQLQQALALGFSGAIEYEAGLGISEDGANLILTQWLPKVRDWQQAAPALEQLLNQLSSWRATLKSSQASLRSTGAVKSELLWRTRLLER